MTCDATAVSSLLNDDGFRVAFVVALLGAALAWWCSRRDITVPVPVIAVVAALAGLRAQHHLSSSLGLGLALLGLAAWAVRGAGARLLGGVALLAGSVFLVVALPDGWPTWISLVVFLTLLTVTPVVEFRARRWDRLAPAALLLATVGAYVCVPDTEVLRPLLAALIVTALVAFVPGVSRSACGSGVVAGLLVWAVGVDGIGRPGSVIGGLGCVAALALLPALPIGRRPGVGWWVATGATAGLVLWCARVAGFVHSGLLAALLVAIGFAVAVPLVLVTAAGRFRRRP
jgi:hypothetical protein